MVIFNTHPICCLADPVRGVRGKRGFCLCEVHSLAAPLGREISFTSRHLQIVFIVAPDIVFMKAPDMGLNANYFWLSG